jgi:hypothetical protein
MGSNQFNTAVIIADKMLEYFDGVSMIASKINTDYRSDFLLTPEGHGVGQTIYVEKPPRFQSIAGPAITQTEPINPPKIPVMINTWRTVPVDLSGMDLTFNARNFDIWAEKWLKPLVSPLANDVDVAIFNLWSQIANQVGTCGTGFGSTSATAYDLMASAAEKLDYFLTPQTDRITYVNPTAARKFGSAIATGYNPQGEISEVFRRNKLSDVAGFEMYKATNIQTYTGGTLVTGDSPTTATSGAVMSGTNGINVASVTTHTLPVGAVINIAGVYSVNPVTKLSTSLLADLVVTQAFTGNTTGTIQVQTSDGKGLIASGAYQNVSNLPATSKAITISGVPVATTGVYPMNLALWKKALGLVTVPIKAPKGLDSVQRNYKGIGITISYGPDIMNFRGIWRADMVFGTCVYYPENACRVIGN